MTKELALSFRLINIKTEEFAILEDSYREGEQTRMGTFMDFGVDEEKHILGINVKFQFEQNEKPFLVVSVSCGFELEDEAWNSLYDKENHKIVIPEGFASHMAVLTIGTARGVLHEKTVDTEFNNFIIPPINLTTMIKEDIDMDLNFNK